MTTIDPKDQNIDKPCYPFAFELATQFSAAKNKFFGLGMQQQRFTPSPALSSTQDCIQSYYSKTTNLKKQALEKYMEK